MKQQTLANTNKPPAPPPPLIPSGTPTKQDSSTMNGLCNSFILTLSYKTTIYCIVDQQLRFTEIISPSMHEIKTFL